MTNDERFLNLPHLPQYGELRAMCDASLPTGLKAFAVLGVGFFFLLVMGVINAAIQEMPVAIEVQGMVLVITSIVVFLALWWAVKRFGRSLSHQALFVYDGGIHLNEGVTYVISYGRSFEICSGMRHVSIPWRLIEKFKVKEVNRRGNQAVEASLRLPDGRTLCVSTVDGKGSADAIGTLLDQLGESR